MTNKQKNEKTTVFNIRIKKGDTVVVTAGKFKGQTGKVTATHPRENKVTVEGINVVKRHLKRDERNPQGGVKEITKPMWVSKVALIDPSDKKPTRVGYKFDKEGNKVRVYKRSGKEVK